MIVKPRSIPAFLSRPDPAVRAVLIYGGDEGLVRERVETLMQSVVADLTDPFLVADFRADLLKDDPARLADEAAAIAMTGGRRAVRIRSATNQHSGVFADFLADPSGDALVVIEGGELPKSSALRKAFEGSPAGAALPCYPDEGRGLEQLITEHLKDRHGLGVERNALAYMCQRLGNDRRLTRQELDKLALFKGNSSGGTVTLEEAEGAIGDAGAVQLDEIVFAATGGDLSGLDWSLGRYFAAGESPIPVLRALTRHLERLQVARSAVDRGRSAAEAMKSLRPPVFFKQEQVFGRQLQAWRSERLSAALQIALEAEIDCKTTGLPAEAMCGRALLRIGSAARSRSSGRPS
jgi:DNA polymerase III subunit delta